MTAARHLAGRYVADWGCDGLVADAELLVSEMVANAVMHAGTGLVLELDLDDERLRIEVGDDCSDVPPVTRPVQARAGARSGWGLLLVDRLADRWGAHRVGSGKVVWCELAASAPAGRSLSGCAARVRS